MLKVEKLRNKAVFNPTDRFGLVLHPVHCLQWLKVTLTLQNSYLEVRILTLLIPIDENDSDNKDGWPAGSCSKQVLMILASAKMLLL